MNNNKVILVIFLFCLFVNTNAQEIKLGVKLLPGITKGFTASANNYLSSSEFDSLRQSRLTFNYGITLNYQIEESKLFIESGLFYSNRGSLIKGFTTTYIYGSQGFGYMFRETKSDIYIYDYYLTAPILFGYKYKYFYASVGPTFGYNIFRKWVWTLEENKIYYDRWKESRFINNVSVGMDLNIGTEINLSKKFDLIFECGFEISNFKNEDGEIIYYKNAEFGICLNYKI